LHNYDKIRNALSIEAVGRRINL